MDRDWYAQSREMVRAYQGELRRVLRFLSDPAGALHRPVRGGDVRLCRLFPARRRRSGAGCGWDAGSPIRAVVSGRKVYFFPPGVDKGTALCRAAERFGPERVIAAGDSVIDVPMLRRADLALLPGPELLPLLPGARVCGPGQRFPDFVLSAVLRDAASPART